MNIAMGPSGFGHSKAVLLPLPNLWLGVSVEDQTRADERIPLLLQTPAAVRFISAEPLLGPVDLTALDVNGFWMDALTSEMEVHGKFCRGLDWIICGGESGPNARPMHPDWARALRDQCAAAGVPFFFKQWGDWAPDFANDKVAEIALAGAKCAVWRADKWNYFESGYNVSAAICDDNEVYRVGKSRVGRLLDGVEHNAMPAVFEAKS